MANAKQILSSMRYKSFTWEYNPASCTYSCDRTYVAHKYPELAGVELEDMDINEVVITGKGEFFGENAYSNWLKLNAEFKTFGPGEFYHPIFTDVTQALMTKLHADMEPRENYVAYSFEFIGNTAINEINTPSVIEQQDKENPVDNTYIKVGDIVILTGYAYYDSYGSSPHSSYRLLEKHTVTNVNYNGTHPIHCGSLGWCTRDSVKLANSSTSTSSPTTANTNDILYTVKPGDTLSGICAKYGADWKLVASYNNIKIPQVIQIGQEIRIPQHLAIRKQAKVKAISIGVKNITPSRSSASGGGTLLIRHMLN